MAWREGLTYDGSRTVKPVEEMEMSRSTGSWNIPAGKSPETALYGIWKLVKFVRPKIESGIFPLMIGMVLGSGMLKKKWIKIAVLVTNHGFMRNEQLETRNSAPLIAVDQIPVETEIVHIRCIPSTESNACCIPTRSTNPKKLSKFPTKNYSSSSCQTEEMESRRLMRNMYRTLILEVFVRRIMLPSTAAIPTSGPSKRQQNKVRHARTAPLQPWQPFLRLYAEHFDTPMRFHAGILTLWPSNESGRLTGGTISDHRAPKRMYSDLNCLEAYIFWFYSLFVMKIRSPSRAA